MLDNESLSIVRCLAKNKITYVLPFSVIMTPYHESYSQTTTNDMSHDMSKISIPFGIHVLSGYESCDESLGDPMSRYEHQ